MKPSIINGIPTWGDWANDQSGIAQARKKKPIRAVDLPNRSEIKYVKDNKTGHLIALWRGRIVTN